MFRSLFYLRSMKHTKNSFCALLDGDNYYLHFNDCHLLSNQWLLLNKTERNYCPFKPNYRQICMNKDRTLAIWFKKKGCKADFEALLTFFMADLNNDLMYAIYAGNKDEIQATFNSLLQDKEGV